MRSNAPKSPPQQEAIKSTLLKGPLGLHILGNSEPPYLQLISWRFVEEIGADHMLDGAEEGDEDVENDDPATLLAVN